LKNNGNTLVIIQNKDNVPTQKANKLLQMRCWYDLPVIVSSQTCMMLLNNKGTTCPHKKTATPYKWEAVLIIIL